MSEPPIAWVKVIPPNEAEGDLAEAYDTVKGADGVVENLYLAMSQTPRAIQPAHAHYLAVLHNPDNPLEPWLAELVSTYVAMLCGCDYAVQNHGANFTQYLGDADRAGAILEALEQRNWDALEDAQMLAALRYARKLSLTPEKVSEGDIAALREAGFCDKGVSYLIQLIAGFAYWARMINGLGIQLGDTIGIAGVPRSDV